MPLLIRENKYFNIETFPDDEHIRVYHSRLRLMDPGWQHVEAYKGVKLLSATEDLPSIMQFALDVEGVTWVKIAAHTLTVRKSPIFTWEDIDQKMIELWVGMPTAFEPTFQEDDDGSEKH